MPPDRRETEAGIPASIGAGGEARSYETERLRKDGTSVPVSLTISVCVWGWRDEWFRSYRCETRWRSDRCRTWLVSGATTHPRRK
ncbi:hypothetical protein [Arthrobacter sp. ISL-69]|uniref:hypothetical protein n=1 Tax=Arthrobacter sp. ISL-69 TaxID=2819113 RepID=UPI0037C1B298